MKRFCPVPCAQALCWSLHSTRSCLEPVRRHVLRCLFCDLFNLDPLFRKVVSLASCSVDLHLPLVFSVIDTFSDTEATEEMPTSHLLRIIIRARTSRSLFTEKRSELRSLTFKFFLTVRGRTVDLSREKTRVSTCARFFDQRRSRR